MKLVSTGSPKDPTWATLSYCWGTEQKAQTTRHNVHERCTTIQLCQLPTTPQDEVCPILFLWVDSICMIQDNEDDKWQGISKMAEVYQGLVIFSTASSSSRSSGLRVLLSFDAWIIVLRCRGSRNVGLFRVDPIRFSPTSSWIPAIPSFTDGGAQSCSPQHYLPSGAPGSWLPLSA